MHKRLIIIIVILLVMFSISSCSIFKPYEYPEQCVVTITYVTRQSNGTIYTVKPAYIKYKEMLILEKDSLNKVGDTTLIKKLYFENGWEYRFIRNNIN